MKSLFLTKKFFWIFVLGLVFWSPGIWIDTRYMSWVPILILIFFVYLYTTQKIMTQDIAAVMSGNIFGLFVFTTHQINQDISILKTVIIGFILAAISALLIDIGLVLLNKIDSRH